MKKYLYIFKSEVMNSLQYAFNFFSSIFSYFIFIYIFLQVWKYIYSDPSSYINGYNLGQMIWYLIITELVYSVGQERAFIRNISNEVKTGNIAYNISKPYNYVTYSLFSHLGSIIIRGIIFLVVAILIGFLFVHKLPEITILQFILCLLSLVLAFVVSTLISIIIGLLSFFIEDSSPIYWIYSKLILVAGTMFPIEFFPKMIQPILNYSPVFVTVYGPAKLVVNFSYLFFAKVFIIQLLYILIVYIIARLIYRKGVKRINVNGG